MAYFTVNGVKLYYEVKGDPNGTETVAFMNGVMASASSWAFQTPVFEKAGFRIILHDFKGQTLSDKPAAEAYSFAEHAAEAKALYEELGATRLHLIGTSYGGEVAMKFAALYPDMVKTLSVIDSVCELDDVLKAFVLSWKTLASCGDGEAFFWGMAPSIYGPKFMAEHHDMLAERARACRDIDPSYYEGQKILYETFARDVDMRAELPGIRCPALVVCGEDDILKKPKFSRTIYELIPNAEYVILPDCGHVTIFEQPDALCTCLFGFIMKNL